MASTSQHTGKFTPFIADSQMVPEFTVKSVLLGALFGIIFGAANAYLGLRAGLTISTSIPVAVMTVAVFRALESTGRRGSIPACSRCWRWRCSGTAWSRSSTTESGMSRCAIAGSSNVMLLLQKVGDVEIIIAGFWRTKDFSQTRTALAGFGASITTSGSAIATVADSASS